MTILALAVLVGILGLVIAVITRPLTNAKSQNIQPMEDTADTLQAAYQLVLTRIRDLEQDYLEGKMDKEDYQARREALHQDAVGFLQQLDKASPAK